MAKAKHPNEVTKATMEETPVVATYSAPNIIIKKPLKVAIIGTTPHRTQAPYGDDSWEIWAQSMPNLPRWTRWFEIHNPGILQSNHKPLWNWLIGADQPGMNLQPVPDGVRPIYMRQAMEEVKGSVAYPKQAIEDMFGAHFLTSTAAMEIAFAIAEGATEIGIFGIDMANSREWREQKPGVLHFIQAAKWRGIKVYMPTQCELLARPIIYGLEDDPTATLRTAKKEELNKRKEEILQVQQNMAMEFHMIDGALKMIEHAENNWGW